MALPRPTSADTDRLSHRPGFALVGILRIPELQSSPLRAIIRRIAIGLFTLLAAATIVYLGRDGYRDNNGGDLSFLDALYYSTVSLSTTGYGDITPVSPSARLINILVITPLRILFL